MQAVTIDQYGSSEVMHLAEIEKPRPGAREVLVEVHCSSLNPVDWKIRRGDLKLIIPRRFPRALGIDVSGVIVEVGRAVTRFKVGDEVFGMANPLANQFGGYAQFALVEELKAALKPQHLSFADAASIPVAGLTAYKTFHEHAKLLAGQRVLINGASGGVGSFAVQMAKAIGALVVATCSESNREFVRAFGADQIMDYGKIDLAQLDQKFDCIFDASAKLHFSKIKHLLTKNGSYVTTVPNADMVLGFLSTVLLPGKKVYLVNAGIGARISQELTEIAALFGAKKIRSVITHTISFQELAQAHMQAEAGHNRGKTVILVG
jgi:NADPH:quinone reductase-like Zn-dependent oxidoreductase